jgi:hypothetical protein
VKIAVASGGSPDYMIDIVADGMIRLLGRGSVHLHYKHWSTIDHRWEHLLKSFTPDQLALEECDGLVVSTREPVETVTAYKRSTGRPVVVLDGEDWPGLHEEHLAACDVYFKREYFRTGSYASKIRPLAFAVIPEAFPRAPTREIPVMFSAGGSYAGRDEIREAVQRAGGEVSTTLSHDEYMRRLGWAKIGVSARGFGHDTYRYWETPWAGAVLLSARLDIVIEQDFVEDEEAIFFDSADEMTSKAQALLRDATRLDDIATAGLVAVTTRHLSVHRAVRVLDEIVSIRRSERR